MLFTPIRLYRVFQSTVLCALTIALSCMIDRTAYAKEPIFPLRGQ